MTKNYLQYPEFNFDEIYASIARFSIIQILIIITIKLDFKIHQMNIITTFLYEEFEKRIYIKQSKKHVIPDKEDHVLFLLKSLYELKQASYI